MFKYIYCIYSIYSVYISEISFGWARSQGKFKWKVNTNTAYIWSGSGGGLEFEATLVFKYI